MIHIVLKNRKTLCYNGAHNTRITDGICTVFDKQDCWIAKIPTPNIERIEVVKPCRILKDHAAPKRADY